MLEAIEEVENNLIEFSEEQKRYQQLSDALEISENSTKLTETLHANGHRNYNDVLETQLNLQQNRERVILSELRSNRSLIKLYRALGGGWQHWRRPQTAK